MSKDVKQAWHEQAIQNLMKKCPKVKKYGFYKELREVFYDDGWGGQDLKAKSYGYIPDAFIINEKMKNVVMFEVVDTHKITEARMFRIYNLWFGFDCESWDLQLVAIYRGGGKARVNIGGGTGINLTTD